MIPIQGLKTNGQYAFLYRVIMQPGEELGRLQNSLVIIHKSTLHNITITNVTYVPLLYYYNSVMKGFSWSKYALVVWSVLGITDLVYAVSLGALIESGTSAMATFPWVLIPTVGVTFDVALHGITLYRLRKMESPPLR